MGWQKKILRVNLTQGTIIDEPLNLEWANDYLGMRGLGTKYLWEEMDPSVDPMSSDNVLIFATGPLTGTMASTGGRYAIITKGPLTNAIACSNAGGKFGAELKYAGYDMLIIKGKSKIPVYLSIHNDQKELISAEDIWGQSVWKTDEWIRNKRRNSQVKIAAIGVPGENGIKYACVINDLHRAAGRSGVGAVMGSKNLKAIAVRGTIGLKVDNPNEFMEIIRNANSELHSSMNRRVLMRDGTLEMMDSMQEFGGLPTENFKKVSFNGVDKINHTSVIRKNRNGHVNLQRNSACFSCTIGCGRIAKIDPKHFSVKDRPEYWIASGGLEYETAFAFGPLLGIDDLDALTFAGFLMNEHGIDTISFGVTLAAAMELYEKGVIKKQHTDGIALSFGNEEALVLMSEKICKQEGFGKDLGLGARLLCKKYGLPELAMVTKGQELAGYDGRSMQGMGLGYATSNRGACHLRHDTFQQDFANVGTKGKANECVTSQNFIAMVDSSGLCLFTTSTWGYKHFTKMIHASCPGNWTEERLKKIGERIWNLEKLFNLKSGLSRKDDTLPLRMLKEPLSSGCFKGSVTALDVMLPEYYEIRGWDQFGIPTQKKLKSLNLI